VAASAAPSTAVSAQRIFIMMEHTTRDGSPRLLSTCALPLTAAGVVKLVMTDYGLFEPKGDHFVLHEIAHGFRLEDVQAVTGAKIVASPALKEVSV
jgi:acyl CoA:acetate/3-ketoacid CoA transferase beta subunit